MKEYYFPSVLCLMGILQNFSSSGVCSSVFVFILPISCHTNRTTSFRSFQQQFTLMMNNNLYMTFKIHTVIFFNHMIFFCSNHMISNRLFQNNLLQHDLSTLKIEKSKITFTFEIHFSNFLFNFTFQFEYPSLLISSNPSFNSLCSSSFLFPV